MDLCNCCISCYVVCFVFGFEFVIWFSCLWIACFVVMLMYLMSLNVLWIIVLLDFALCGVVVCECFSCWFGFCLVLTECGGLLLVWRLLLGLFVCCSQRFWFLFWFVVCLSWVAGWFVCIYYCDWWAWLYLLQL